MSNHELLTDWYKIDDSHDIEKLCKILKPVDIVEIKTSESIQPAICSRVDKDPRVFIVSHVHSTSTEKYIKNIALSELPKESEIRINNAGDNVYCRTFIAKDNGLFFGELWKRQRDRRDGLDTDHCSRWFSEEDLPEFESIVWEGDMVEFNRINVYSHWAISCKLPWYDRNNNMLAHRSGAGDSVDLFKKLQTGKIMLSPIKDVIHGCRFRINNSWDKLYSHRLFEEEIVVFALKTVASESFGKYNVAFNNCWHFVMQARYGVNIRDHIDLRTNWFTNPKEFIPLLSVGDIIRIEVPNGQGGSKREDLAIYIGSGKVAHLGDGNAEVCESSIKKFITTVARYAKFRIENFFDQIWKPKTSVQVVNYDRGTIGKENAKVCESSLEEFLTTVARDAKFRIENFYDQIWEPKTSVQVVNYVRRTIGTENNFFVVGARYGKTVQDAIAKQAGTLSMMLPVMETAYREHRRVQNARSPNPEVLRGVAKGSARKIKKRVSKKRKRRV